MAQDSMRRMLTRLHRRYGWRGAAFCVALVLLMAWFMTGRGFRGGRAGLRAENHSFSLDGRQVMILSGALHYFRVVPEYWRDRMLKMKAAGLNTVETYSPWNLHEEMKGQFNFAGLLDLRRFVQLADSLGLLVILRPGPFICSEWEFGGLPSWLLRDPNMLLRQPYRPYLDAVERYLVAIIQQVKDLQYSAGGPIIAFQIENEYSAFSTDNSDLEYLLTIKQILRRHGITDLLFTSDNGNLDKLPMADVLKTANFNDMDSAVRLFRSLGEVQPQRPLMVMEFWCGWFDHWEEKHHTVKGKDQETVLRFILKRGASVNFYMFHGGTNFGFMNGANAQPFYTPTVTSYDYDAPISESGDLTPKYYIIRKTLQEMLPSVLNQLPDPPLMVPRHAYGKIQIQSVLPWKSLLKLIKPEISKVIIPMELLNINSGNGQSYGFILYSKEIKRHASNIRLKGYVKDRAQVFVNSREVGLWDWRQKDPSLTIPSKKSTNQVNHLEILVENLGRVNYATKESKVFQEQFKGLVADVFWDNQKLEDWHIYPLEFKPKFITRIHSATGWLKYLPEDLLTQPAVYRGSVFVSGQPRDTFISLTGWQKGVVFINDFNLGRYWAVGPQQTLYLPAPLLHQGHNQVLIFELHKSSPDVSLVDQPNLG